MRVSQDAFRQAVFNPEARVPAGLINPDGSPATKRFDVYRNNVAVSLTNALAEAFPIVRKLVGEVFFNAMAGVYLRNHPPQSPVIALYGAEMPEFLRGFEPAQTIGYLPDIAELEQALRHAYQAADVTVCDIASLQTMSTDQLIGTRLKIAPAVGVVRSEWPIHAIHLSNTDPDAPKPEMIAQDVLITRPEFDPMMTVLPAGGAEFATALKSGDTFGHALEAASAKEPTFDLTATLAALLDGQAITQIGNTPS